MLPKVLKKGLKIMLPDGEQGEVNFISNEYITVCTHRWKKPPELAEHSMNKYNEVNVLCYTNCFPQCKYYDEELQEWKYLKP
jgi:hypothetical protein